MNRAWQANSKTCTKVYLNKEEASRGLSPGRGRQGAEGGGRQGATTDIAQGVKDLPVRAVGCT